ncbi:MAG: methyltransferase [Candidatus Aenigmatarchaeota archaeon]
MKTKIVSIDEVMKNGKISKYSPALLIAKELNLKYLVIEEDIITGPAVGTSIIVDKLTRNFKFNKILDLCCGTGALTKISILNGVNFSTCVDKNLKAVKENLKEFKNVKFLKKDIFKLKINEFFDLTILDPPRYLIEKVVKKFNFENLNTNILVFWHGSSEEKEWHYYVKSVMEKYFKKIYSFSIYGEEFFLCSKTKEGIKILDKFFKMW